MFPRTTFKHTIQHIVSVASRVGNSLITLIFGEDNAPYTIARKKRSVGPQEWCALFSYRNKAIRRAIWRMKYHRSTAITRYFARELANQIADDFSTGLFETHASVPLCLIPIPASKERIALYGCNHMTKLALLCRNTLQNMQIPIKCEVQETLFKHKETPRQTSRKTRALRLANMQGSMRITHTAVVRGKVIIILDDVYTTGATVTEAVRALKQSGAKHIFVYCIAH